MCVVGSLSGHVCMACLEDLVPGIPAQFGGCSDETSLLSTGTVLLPATGGLPESKLLPSRSLFLSCCHVPCIGPDYAGCWIY